MEKPQIAQIGEDLARPYVHNYCKRWGIPFDYDEKLEYGQAVLWMGAFYKGSLRAVIGLMALDEMPDELFIYGFYGDGTQDQYLPLRALMEFLFKFPHPKKFGFVHAENKKMLEMWAKYGGEVVELRESDGKTVAKVVGEALDGRKKQRGRSGTNSS